MALTQVQDQMFSGSTNTTTAIQSNGTTAITIDASQNVGIGTASPTQKLDVAGTVRSTGGFALNNITTSDSISNQFYLQNTAGTKAANLQLGTTGILQTWVYGGSSWVNATTIDSSGNLLVGSTSSFTMQSVGSRSTFSDTANDGAWITGFQATGSTNTRGIAIYYPNRAPNDPYNEAMMFSDSSAVRFAIRSNGGIANYSANNVNLSDERTKKNIVDAGNYLDKICAIPVRTFLYKDQTDNQLNLGVIAQEVETVAPELVSNDGFGETKEGEAPLKSIYQTDLQYALMKCIQELNAKVDAQAAEIAALKAK